MCLIHVQFCTIHSYLVPSLPIQYLSLIVSCLFFLNIPLSHAISAFSYSLLLLNILIQVSLMPCSKSVYLTLWRTKWKYQKVLISATPVIFGAWTFVCITAFTPFIHFAMDTFLSIVLSKWFSCPTLHILICCHISCRVLKLPPFPPLNSPFQSVRCFHQLYFYISSLYFSIS